MALMIRLFLLATLLCIAYSSTNEFSRAFLHCFMEESPICQCKVNAYSNVDDVENLGYNPTQLNKARNWFSHYLNLTKVQGLKTRKERTACREQCRKVYDCFFEPLSLEIGHDIPSEKRIVKLLQRYIELQTPYRYMLKGTPDHMSLLRRILRSEGYITGARGTLDFYNAVNAGMIQGLSTSDIAENIDVQFKSAKHNVKIPFRCQKKAKVCPGFLGNCTDQQYDTDDTCQTACSNRTQYAEGKILNNFELARCRIRMEGCNDNTKVCVCGFSFNQCLESGLPRPTITATAIAMSSSREKYLFTYTCNVAGYPPNGSVWYEIRWFHPEYSQEPEGSLSWSKTTNKAMFGDEGFSDKLYFRCRAKQLNRSWSEFSGNGFITELN